MPPVALVVLPCSSSRRRRCRWAAWARTTRGRSPPTRGRPDHVLQDQSPAAPPGRRRPPWFWNSSNPSRANGFPVAAMASKMSTWVVIAVDRLQLAAYSRRGDRAWLPPSQWLALGSSDPDGVGLHRPQEHDLGGRCRRRAAQTAGFSGGGVVEVAAAGAVDRLEAEPARRGCSPTRRPDARPSTAAAGCPRRGQAWSDQVVLARRY